MRFNTHQAFGASIRQGSFDQRLLRFAAWSRQAGTFAVLPNATARE